MSRKSITWLAIAATAIMLIVVDYLHIGVTHYNLFLSILVGWILGMVLLFKRLGPDPELEEG